MEKLKQHEIYINAFYPVKFFLRIPKLDKMIKSLKKSSVKKQESLKKFIIGFSSYWHCTKNKFSIKNFFGKCDQIRSFIFCAMWGYTLTFKRCILQRILRRIFKTPKSCEYQ